MIYALIVIDVALLIGGLFWWPLFIPGGITGGLILVVLLRREPRPIIVEHRAVEPEPERRERERDAAPPTEPTDPTEPSEPSTTRSDYQSKGVWVEPPSSR